MEAYQQYDIAQLAIKLYMNASYGCFGFAGFKYADKRTTELITGIGRKFAMGAKEMAESEKHNFKCIYGDTDGLVLIDKDLDVSFSSDKTFTHDNIKTRIKPLIDDCFQRFNLPIDNDRNFIEVTPVEKKQYFGIDLDTKKVLIKGLEGKKRDACRFNREQFKLLMSNYEKGIDPIPDVRAGLEQLQKGEVTAEDLVFRIPLKQDADKYPLTSALGKVARACNGKKNGVVEYYLTGVKGNAWSPNIEDCNITEYLDEHLTDIGKVLYAMGYDVNELYGPEMQASKKLLKRREKNDNKMMMMKKKKQKPLDVQQEMLF
jgi:DNA polymerase elongation subunit (family B)